MTRGVSHLDSPAWDREVLQMPRFHCARTYRCYVLVLQCTPSYEGKAKKVKEIAAGLFGMTTTALQQ